MSLRSFLPLAVSLLIISGLTVPASGRDALPSSHEMARQSSPTLSWDAAPTTPERGAGFREGKQAQNQRGVRVESWTSTSHAVTNFSGETRLELFPEPTFHRTAKGEWVKMHARVDEIASARSSRSGPKGRLAKAFSDGYQVVASGGAVPIAFGDGGRNGLLQMALPGGVVTWHLNDMVATTPVVISESDDETVVEYHEAFRGVDLRYRVNPGAVKEEFIIKDSASARDFVFTISDPKDQFGNFSINSETHEISFPEPAIDGISITLAAPMAWSETDPATKHETKASPEAGAHPGDGSAHQAISKIESGYQVTVGLEDTWSESASFPVVLDPTMEYSFADSTLATGFGRTWFEYSSLPQGGYAPHFSDCLAPGTCEATAFADGSMFYQGEYTNDPSLERPGYAAYIQADLSNIPFGTKVESAELKVDADQSMDGFGRPPTMTVAPATFKMQAGERIPRPDGWWEPGPHANFWTAETPSSSTDPWQQEADVTDIVQEFVNNEVGDHAGFVIGTYWVCNFGAVCRGAGSESSSSVTPPGMVNSAHGRWLRNPSLVITYTGAVLPPPLPVEQTWGCDCRWAHGSNRVALQADPVNTATGALMERSVDASSGAVGIPLQVGRTYNGQDSSTGMLGVGWSSDFETSLTDLGTGAFVFRDPTGGRTKFTTLPSGEFLADVGATSTLTSVAGGGWQVRSAVTGEVLTFNSSGQLVSDVDINGRGLEYTYTSGRLTSITDATGGVTELTYASSGAAPGALVQVELPAGQTVSYAYTVIAGHPRLTSVVGVEGETTTLSYTSTGVLNGISDPGQNSSAESTYGTDERIVSQADPAGGIWEFDWKPSPRLGSPSGTGIQTTTGPDGTITQNYYYGNSLIRQSIRPYEGGPAAETSYTYDSAHNLVAVRDPNGRVTTMTYDGAGRMLTRTAPNPVATVESWTYDAQGRLLTSTNGAGETTRFHYDAAGNRDWVENAEDERTQFEHNSLGLLTKQTSPTGRETTHTYDARGNRLSSTVPGGATTTWTYDARDRVLTEVSPRGNVSGATATDFTTSYTYDAGDRVKTVTAPNGNVTTYGYDLAGRQASLVVKDATAATLSASSWTYDNAGNELTATINGRTTTNTYNNDGSLATITDPAGLKTSYWWESDRLTGVHRSNADETEWYLSEWFYYDLAGQKIAFGSNASMEWGSSETHLTYDAAGRVKKSSTFMGYDTNYEAQWAETTFTYDGAGRVTKTVDADGGESLTGYDDIGRVVSTQAPDRPAAVSTYDDDGLLISSTAPGGGTTTYTYTPGGQVATVTDPKGNAPGAVAAEHRVTSTYDVEGNLLSTTDQLGNSTTNTYDNLSRLVTETNQLNKTTSYAYDASSNLIKVTSPPTSGTSNGAETEYAYNVHGELTKRTDELDRETVYTLDLDSGRTTAITDPLNRTKEFTYDSAGRLTGWTNPSGSTVAQTFTPGGLLAAQIPSTGVGSVRNYNEAGLLTRIADTSGSQATDFTYNKRGLLTRADGPDGVFEYTYAADGNVASRTYPDGTVIEYDHDNDGLPVEQQVTRGNSTHTVIYDYDPAGLLIETTYPTSTGGGGPPMTQARTYDNAGRITAVTNTGSGVGTQGSLATTYTRDEAGQPISITEKRGTGPSATTHHTGYAYTGQGWIARECDYGATAPTASCSATTTPRVTYGYDAVGNQTTLTRTGPSGITTETQVSTYDAADQLATTITTLGAGSPSTKNYSYNANGQLTTDGRTYDALGRITGKNNPGTGQVAYTYNPQGQRVTMTRTGTNAGAQNLTWDTNNALPLIAQTENTGDTLGAGVGEQTHLWTPHGLPLATHPDSGDPLWYTHDALGSVTDATTHTGAPVTSARYTLFGEQTLTDNQATPATVPINPGFGYTSGFNQLGDPELHLRARDYDPTMRAFTAPDPLAPDNGAPAINTYHYANNSPLVYIDPSGEWGIDINGAWRALKDAGSTVVTTAKNVGVGFWDNTTNHVPACAARDTSACGGLFLDLVTAGTAEAAAADLSGCADRNLASCGWLWVDLVTLGTQGGGAARSACVSVKKIKNAPHVKNERGSINLPGKPGSKAAKTVGPLTERQIGTTMDDILGGASFVKQSKATQYAKPGGFGQANADFDALARGVTVIDRGGGLRTATLSNGTKINVRPFSSGNDITLEVVTPGNPALKIRYAP